MDPFSVSGKERSMTVEGKLYQKREKKKFVGAQLLYGCGS